MAIVRVSYPNVRGAATYGCTGRTTARYLALPGSAALAAPVALPNGEVVESSIGLYQLIYATTSGAVVGPPAQPPSTTAGVEQAIVVFLPVSLVEGPGQFFLLRLAIPVRGVAGDGQAPAAVDLGGHQWVREQAADEQQNASPPVPHPGSR